MATKHGYQAKYAIINASLLGDNTIVAAVSGMAIRVVSLYAVSSNTNTLTFQSSTTTNISGPIDLTSQEKMVLPLNEYGWIETSSGELLNLNLTVANKVAGMLTYFLV